MQISHLTMVGPAAVPDWEQAPEFGRRETILRTLQRLCELCPGPVTIVETGTLRNDSSSGLSGDGWSTVAWGWYCSQMGGKAYTVDIDAGALAVCRRITEPYAAAMEYIAGDSVRFLRDWGEQGRGEIHLLYMDSLDYLDHARSEAHHLAEAEAALPSLAAPSLVLIDDTSAVGAPREGGSQSFSGKGARAIPFLLEQGFRVEWSAGGQVLLSRGARTDDPDRRTEGGGRTRATLDELALRYGTDKGPQAHNYLRHYARHLADRQDEAITILEIGVQSGASLRVWRDAFPRARIIGIDIDPEAVGDLGERVEVVAGDQADAAFLSSLAERLGPFDVIIDDGSHNGAHQRISFETLYPSVKPGGFYIVEDLHTGYWGWGPSFIEYVKGRMDEVLYPGQSALGDPRNHPQAAAVFTRMNDFQRETMCIHLYSNLVVFEKFPAGEAYR